jgi:outer membrane lipoprotein-sorting protein
MIVGFNPSQGSMRALLALILGLLATISTAQAATLSDRDRADVTKAATDLNGITSLKAHFLQFSDNGGQAEGTAYLSRPGRLRLQYDPPSPLLLLADGSFLIVDDKRYDNPSYIPLDSTPAGVLVRPHVVLNGDDLKVTGVSRQPGIVTITVISAGDPGQGQLALVFSERPFQLRQWQVTDAQGQVTTVSLFDVQTGIALDRKLFQYQNARSDVLN